MEVLRVETVLGIEMRVESLKESPSEGTPGKGRDEEGPLEYASRHFSENLS
jgi:hypothetical protein